MQPSLNLLPTIQQAIANLLTVYEPEFLRFGHGLFLSFATIIICWQGIRMMLSHEGLGDQMFEFAKLLMTVAFGYSFITFYEAPLPGIGVSFMFQRRLDRRERRPAPRPAQAQFGFQLGGAAQEPVHKGLDPAR